MSNVLQSILLQAEQSMQISDTCIGISHDSLVDMRTMRVSVIDFCSQCDHALDNICTEYSKCKCSQLV